MKHLALPLLALAALTGCDTMPSAYEGIVNPAPWEKGAAKDNFNVYATGVAIIPRDNQDPINEADLQHMALDDAREKFEKMGYKSPRLVEVDHYWNVRAAVYKVQYRLQR